MLEEILTQHDDLSLPHIGLIYIDKQARFKKSDTA